MGTHPIFESDFDCLTECHGVIIKVDQLDQWGVNKHIQWVRVIHLALVVADLVDHKWVSLQIIIKWRQIQTKWDRHKVKWDKIWEGNNPILMTQFINSKNGSEIKRIASFC